MRIFCVLLSLANSHLTVRGRKKWLNIKSMSNMQLSELYGEKN